MTYSYTQISQYLSCPRRYKYRYVDGWEEKDTRAGMLFGRAFEAALGAFFRREDCGQSRQLRLALEQWTLIQGEVTTESRNRDRRHRGVAPTVAAGAESAPASASGLRVSWIAVASAR